MALEEKRDLCKNIVVKDCAKPVVKMLEQVRNVKVHSLRFAGIRTPAR